MDREPVEELRVGQLQIGVLWFDYEMFCMGTDVDPHVVALISDVMVDGNFGRWRQLEEVDCGHSFANYFYSLVFFFLLPVSHKVKKPW